MLTPLPLARRTTNRLFVLPSADGCGPDRLLKLYAGRGAAARRDAEAGMLRRWADRGVRVPRLPERQPDVPELGGRPHLVMELVPGRSLRDLLADAARPIADRRDALGAVLAEMAARHARAIDQRDPCLILRDANTGNFLVTDRQVLSGDGDRRRVVHIDLEGAPPDRKLTDAAARELGRFVRWAARDLGAVNLRAVVGLAAAAYAGLPSVPERIVLRTLARRGQRFHRWRSWRRAVRAPWDVTKYDVADAVARELAA